MKKTVILVGTNSITRHHIPWDREDADYWLFNECGSLRDDRPDYWAKRCDGVFQMHTPRIWRNQHNINHQGHYAWLKQPHQFPVYMQDVYEDVPASVKYPINEIIEHLLPTLKNELGEQVESFTSTAAYAIALAVHLGYKKIELYGIEATSDTEYFRQKPGILFWVGIATGYGVHVQTHSQSLLIKELRYGYTGEIMIQRQEFEMSLKAYQNMAKQAEVSTFESIGKVKAILTALAATKSNADATRLYGELQTALDEDRQRVYEYGEIAGKVYENTRYLKECDALIIAAGGEKALKALQENPAPVAVEGQPA